jgi:hypothetical protein
MTSVNGRLIGLGVLLMLAACGPGSTLEVTRPAEHRQVAATGSTSWFPARGDCGEVRAARTVVPAPCGRPRAEVTVASLMRADDPGRLCPLYTRTSVLFTVLRDGWIACWAPIEGGPERRFGDAADLLLATTSFEPSEGMCGDLHDEHVHAPKDCTDPTADGSVLAVLPEGSDASACPMATTLWVPENRACWGSR